MYIIGENIHILSDKVKEAVKTKDAKFFQDLAVKQVQAGANAVDLNLGPRKADWMDMFPWIVKTVEAVVDVPLSIDTTNILGVEAALQTVTKAQPIINSVSAEPERLEKVPLLAKQYNARLVALTMSTSGIPVAADERVNIAVEQLIPRMMEIDYPMENLIIDPLVLTVSGCQQYCPHLIEAVSALLFKRRQVFHSLVVEGRVACAGSSGLLVVAFHGAMGIEVVLDYGQAGLSGCAYGRNDVLDLFVAAGLAVEGVPESAYHQVVQGQALSLEALDAASQVRLFPGNARPSAQHVIHAELLDPPVAVVLLTFSDPPSVPRAQAKLWRILAFDNRPLFEDYLCRRQGRGYSHCPRCLHHFSSGQICGHEAYLLQFTCAGMAGLNPMRVERIRAACNTGVMLSSEAIVFKLF